MVSSGTYSIQSASAQKVVRLATNTPNKQLELVDSSFADNESWILKTYDNGTFTLRNKNWTDNSYASVASVSSGQAVKAMGEATRWTRSGDQIVASGFAWEATSDSKIILKPVDSVNANQSFNLN